MFPPLVNQMAVISRAIALAVVIVTAHLITPFAQAQGLADQGGDYRQERADLITGSKIPSGSLKELQDRLKYIEGRINSYDESVTAAVSSADRYSELLTYVAGAVLFLFTIGGAAAGYWIKTEFDGVLNQVKDARTQVDRVRNELSSTIAIARAVPALMRSNLEEKDPDRKRLHAEEAFRYITQAEVAGYKDSHLLNWKAYTLKRMGRRDLALEAAKLAESLAEASDPQKARAWYNIACYHASLSEPNCQEALDALDQAILTNEWYKPVARVDPDFEFLRNLPTDNQFRQRYDKMMSSSPP